MTGPASFDLRAGSDSRLLLIADHASNHVPADIDLGIAPELLETHIAIDIGSAAVTHGLAAALDAPAILAAQSRLVVDLNRERDNPGTIPLVSDGHDIPGNAVLDATAREARLQRFWDGYHRAIARAIRQHRPALLVSLHSFTPRLATADPATPDRPWEIGLLYNADDRAARIAIGWLGARGHVVGDNEPYSGRVLNATMNRHAEANGIAYLGIEIRNTLIDTAEGQARWTGIVTAMVGDVLGRHA